MGRKHYTSEEKLAAVKLYIQYDFSPSAVIYQLGYPSRNRLYGFCFVSSSILSIYELPFYYNRQGTLFCRIRPGQIIRNSHQKTKYRFCSRMFLFSGFALPRSLASPKHRQNEGSNAWDSSPSSSICSAT